MTVPTRDGAAMCPPDCCAPIRGDELTEDDALDLAAALKALADPARLRVLNRVARAGEVCACDLTEPLGLSQPTVSHHLKVLVDHGFLRREQRGKWAYFSLVPGRLDHIAAAVR